MIFELKAKLLLGKGSLSPFSNILFNKQSLEHFIFYIETKSNDIESKFDLIYNIKNEFLDINYVSNKNNLIRILNLNYKKINEKNINNLIELIVKQLIYRNKFIKNYDVNNTIINYIIECISKKNIIFGFKWLEYIKNIKH